MADPEARRLRIYVECAEMYPASAEVFRLQPGDGETFRLWEDNWSRHGRLSGVFPRFYVLSTDLGISVQQAWHEAWAPALLVSLPDQRVDELLRLQELLADQRWSEGAHDAWEWSSPSFTVRAAYRLLQNQGESEDPVLL